MPVAPHHVDPTRGTGSDAAARRATIAGALIGAGTAGLVDGIVFHQILRWHHLLTRDRVPADADCATNSFWDGWFAAGCLALLLIGVGGLWRAAGDATGRGRAVIGAALVGAGGFNLLEGLIDHQLLGLHHVRAGPHQALADGVYLAVAVAIAGIGWSVRRSGPGGGRRAGIEV